MTASVETKNVGHITQIIDRLLTRCFQGQMPNIYNALVVQGTKSWSEVAVT
jgi:hypothetical protein